MFSTLNLLLRIFNPSSFTDLPKPKFPTKHLHADRDQLNYEEQNERFDYVYLYNVYGDYRGNLSDLRFKFFAEVAVEDSSEFDRAMEYSDSECKCIAVFEQGNSEVTFTYKE